jgi:hypothetical protein
LNINARSASERPAARSDLAASASVSVWFSLPRSPATLPTKKCRAPRFDVRGGERQVVLSDERDRLVYLLQ